MKEFKLRRKTKPGRLLRDVPRGSPVTFKGYQFTVLRNACTGETIIANNNHNYIHCDPTDREDGMCEALEFNYNLPSGLYDFEGGGVIVMNNYTKTILPLNSKPSTGKCWELEIVEE